MTVRADLPHAYTACLVRRVGETATYKRGNTRHRRRKFLPILWNVSTKGVQCARGHDGAERRGETSEEDAALIFATEQVFATEQAAVFRAPFTDPLALPQSGNLNFSSHKEPPKLEKTFRLPLKQSCKTITFQ